MSTYFQGYIRKKKPSKRSRSNALRRAPHKQGEILRLRIVTPRKPNSARRPCAKLSLSNFFFTIGHIPGIGHNLRRHSDVLVRGRGPRDLPGVRHSCCRGVYDFLGVRNKNRRRSIYGVPRPDHLIKKSRKKYRNVFK